MGHPRRSFLKKLGLAAAGMAAAPGVLAAASNEKTYDWTMVTSWPKNFPGLGTAAEDFKNLLEIVSGGRIRVKVYAAGELVPPFEVFDAVSRGTAQIGHSASYYWKGKVPEAQYFTAVPFGLTSREMNGWLYNGGGLELWAELYAAHNLVPYPGGNTGIQMGGWYNRKINSLRDLQGLKIRMPGLGGEVMRRAGATPVLLPGGELFNGLKKGVIDATEWVGPYNDLAFGLHRAAKYYYHPGWHEPGTTLEISFNKSTLESLPPDLQEAVKIACIAANQRNLAEFDANNARSFQTVLELPGVSVERFPDSVLRQLREYAEDVVSEVGNSSAIGRRIHKSFTEYRDVAWAYYQVSEGSYLPARAT